MNSLQRRKLSKTEQLALNKEVYRQLMERADDNALYYDTMVMLTLAEEFGWGKRRLRKFWDAYGKYETELHDYYKTTLSSDGINEARFYAVDRLKRYGVDISLWRKLKSNWTPDQDQVWQEHK